MKKKKKKEVFTRLVKVWNLLMKDGSILKAATIEQGPRKPSMCEGCSAPCCKGIFRPILNSEEFESKRFPIAFNEVPLFIKVQAPQVQKLIVLKVDPKKGCPYLDRQTNKCTIWPNCPKSCLAYDCREDIRPEIRAFAKKREKVWKKLKKKKKSLNKEST